MTILEIKPTLTAQFNLVVSDTATRTFFANLCSNWDNEQTYINALPQDTPKIQAACYTYGLLINQELLIKDNTDISGATRITEQVSSDIENRNTTKTDSERKSELYPDGYTGAPDMAQIKARELESGGGETSQDNKQGTVTTTETDKVAKMVALLRWDLPTPQIAKYCNKILWMLIRQDYGVRA